MLAVAPLSRPEEPIAQVAQAQTAAPESPPGRNLSAPTATEIDALFEADFVQEPGSFIEPDAPVESLAANEHFAEVDRSVSGDEELLDHSSKPDHLSNSVTNFSWPTAILFGAITDQTTAQEPGEQPVVSPTNTGQSNDPIRGPPTALRPANSLFSSDFLPSGSSVSGNSEPSAPRQLVVLDPLLDDIDILASGISGPDTDLLILSDDTDPLAQIEAALGRSGQVSAVHIFSHGAAGRLTISGLSIDRELVAARAEALARWSENLTDDATLFLYGCNLAESAAGRQLADQLAGLTGARVAASTDPTGSPLLGGDWQLEYLTGQLPNTGSLVIPAYPGLLLNIISVDDGKLNKAPTAGADKFNFDGSWGKITLNENVHKNATKNENDDKNEDLFNFESLRSS